MTDFIHITHWPTFNLADSFIVIGVALLALGLVRVEHRKSQASPPVEPDPSPGLDRT